MAEWETAPTTKTSDGWESAPAAPPAGSTPKESGLVSALKKVAAWSDKPRPGILPLQNVPGKTDDIEMVTPQIIAGPAGALAKGMLNVGTMASGGSVAEEDLKKNAASVAGLITGDAATPLGTAAGAAGKAMKPAAEVAGAGIEKGAAGLGNAAAHLVGGLGTHTGAETIKQAAKAGYQGGEPAKAFLEAIRGEAPMSDVVTTAKQAISNMRETRNAAYRSGMVDISKDASVLKFDEIEKALAELPDLAHYKGQVTNPKAAETLKAVTDQVAKWKSLDPAEFHTPEGFDALKKSISAIRESTEVGTQSRALVDKAYDAVKGTITKQAPAYADVMKDYQQASDQLYELERGLSLGAKGRPTIDTALRKLQSVMRNNVNTNYGNRLDMVKTLEDEGGVSLRPALAGHALSSVTPRGLGGAVAGGSVLAEMLTHNPALLATLPLQSPRLMGEASYYAGKGAKGITDTLKKLGITKSQAEDIAGTIK